MSATPALELWRREVRRGFRGQRADQPSTWRLDALWRAACWERAALEAEQLGLHESAQRDRKRALAIVLQAAAERRPA